MTTSPATSYSVRTPEDLLAMVPVLLGFEPEESVTLLTFGRAGRRSGGDGCFHARVDLPAGVAGDAVAGDVGDTVLDHELDEMVDSLVDPVVRHRVERLVVVVHSTRRATAGLAGDRLTRALADRAPATEVIDVLHADGRCWWSLLPGRPAGGAGTPYDVSHHPLRVQAVVAGRVTHASRSALAATLEPDEEGRARLEALLVRTGRRAGPAADPAAEDAWVAATVAGAVTSGDVLDDAAALRLLLALGDPRVRDAACRALERSVAVAHVALWRDLLRRSPTGLQAEPAALLGLAAWVAGDGALAWCALDRCAAVAPSHGLAALVAAALQRAVPPSAWESVAAAVSGSAAGTA